jgi:hypothetical protein
MSMSSPWLLPGVRDVVVKSRLWDTVRWSLFAAVLTLGLLACAGPRTLAHGPTEAGTPGAGDATTADVDAGVDELPECCRVPIAALRSKIDATGATGATGAAGARAVPGLVDQAAAWGVAVDGVRLSGRGTLLDVRLRVLDPVAAAPLFDRRIKAHLLHVDTGVAVGVPVPAKIGPLRQTLTGALPEAGRVYFMIFGNPNRTLGAGDTVSLVVGDCRLDGLEIR